MIPSTQEKLEQLEKVTRSPQLQNSESLSALFRFLVRRALEDPAAPPREHEIAIKVFGRTAEFDPKLDSTVRVQASRLRAKLSEYYSAAGTEDSIIVEIPKGGYLARFVERSSPEERSAPPQEPAPTLHARRTMSSVLWFVAGLLCGILLMWAVSARLAPLI
jgi:hypothetical protein